MLSFKVSDSSQEQAAEGYVENKKVRIKIVIKFFIVANFLLSMQKTVSPFKNSKLGVSSRALAAKKL